MSELYEVHFGGLAQALRAVQEKKKIDGAEMVALVTATEGPKFTGTKAVSST